MSDNQRRALCRLAYLLCCLLPTAISTYWICHPPTPIGWSRAIQAELGIETEIDAVESVGPFETILRDLRFTDPELGVLLQTVEARVTIGETNLIQIPYQVNDLDQRGLTCLVKSINQHVIRTGNVNRIWKIRFLQDVVVQRDSIESLAPVVVDEIPESDPWKLLQSEQANRLVLTELQIDVTPTGDGTLATMHFRVKQSDGVDPDGNARVSNVVGVGLSRGALGQLVELDTNQVPLPCWLIDELAPQFPDSFGNQATFVGRLEMMPAPGNLKLFVDGRIERVEIPFGLDGATGEQLFAEIEIDECLLVNGQFEQWNVILDCPSLSPVPIAQSDLFIDSRQVDPRQTIARAIFNARTRTAGDQRIQR